MRKWERRREGRKLCVVSVRRWTKFDLDLDFETQIGDALNTEKLRTEKVRDFESGALLAFWCDLLVGASCFRYCVWKLSWALLLLKSHFAFSGNDWDCCRELFAKKNFFALATELAYCILAIMSSFLKNQRHIFCCWFLCRIKKGNVSLVDNFFPLPEYFMPPYWPRLISLLSSRRQMMVGGGWPFARQRIERRCRSSTDTSELVAL